MCGFSHYFNACYQTLNLLLFHINKTVGAVERKVDSNQIKTETGFLEVSSSKSVVRCYEFGPVDRKCRDCERGI